MTKNNVNYKKVKITIDGVEHTLHYTLNAFCEIEEYYETIQACFEDVQKGKMKAIRLLLWAGFIHENEKLTVKEVGDMINQDNLADVIGAITTGLINDNPKLDGEEGKN